MYRYWTGSAWTEAITPNPQSTPPPFAPGQAGTSGPGQQGAGQAYQGQGQPYGYPQQKRRGVIGWWLAGAAALLAVVVIVTTVVRSMGGTVPGIPDLPGLNPTATTSPNICPPGDSSSPLPTPGTQSGWISGGRLAFPALDGEWVTQFDNRVPWGDLAMEQIVTVQEDFDGTSGHDWVASVLVSDLHVGDGFASTKIAAETVLKCVLGIYYSDTTVTQDPISSSAHEVDGHKGWLIETQLGFDIPGLETKGERVLLLVVQTGTDDYALFYASIPDTRNDLIPDARQAMAGLKVTQ